MANTKQRSKALKDLGMYFAEKGKVMTQAEYISATDKPVLFSGIRRVFRSYSRMLEMLKRTHPELIELANKKPEPVKKVEPVAPKVQPKTSVKPTTVGKVEK